MTYSRAMKLVLRFCCMFRVPEEMQDSLQECLSANVSCSSQIPNALATEKRQGYGSSRRSPAPTTKNEREDASFLLVLSKESE
jgi:hypothetical protein